MGVGSPWDWCRPTGSDQPSGRGHTDVDQRGLAKVSVNGTALIAGNRRGTPSDDESDFNGRGEAFRMGVWSPGRRAQQADPHAYLSVRIVNGSGPRHMPQAPIAGRAG